MHFLKQNHGLAVLAQCEIGRDEKVNQNEVSVGAICSIRSGQLNVLRADHLGLRPIAARALSMFSGVRTVLTLPSGFLFVAEAVVRNFCTQFLSVALVSQSLYLLKTYLR
jgi:hypothetical protein